jgi:hypothetical protein
MTPGWQLLLDRIESETDPVRRANLEMVARHVVEEVAGNSARTDGNAGAGPALLGLGSLRQRRSVGAVRHDR